MVLGVRGAVGRLPSTGGAGDCGGGRGGVRGTRSGRAADGAARDPAADEGAGQLRHGLRAGPRSAGGQPTALGVSHHKLISYGAFVWARRGLNGQKRPFGGRWASSSRGRCSTCAKFGSTTVAKSGAAQPAPRPRLHSSPRYGDLVCNMTHIGRLWHEIRCVWSFRVFGKD
jgi:hypothetical protein